MSGKTICNLLFSPFLLFLHVFILASWRDRSFSGAQPSSLSVTLQNQSLDQIPVLLALVSEQCWCYRGAWWPSCLSQMPGGLPSKELSAVAALHPTSWGERGRGKILGQTASPLHPPCQLFNVKIDTEVSWENKWPHTPFPAWRSPCPILLACLWAHTRVSPRRQGWKVILVLELFHGLDSRGRLWNLVSFLMEFILMEFQDFGPCLGPLCHSES